MGLMITRLIGKLKPKARLFGLPNSESLITDEFTHVFKIVDFINDYVINTQKI